MSAWTRFLVESGIRDHPNHSTGDSSESDDPVFSPSSPESVASSKFKVPVLEPRLVIIVPVTRPNTTAINITQTPPQML